MDETDKPVTDMNTIAYTPHPVDTSNVELSPVLLQLAECMAENVHDVWAKPRIDQGWTYVSKWDDANKKHPCLNLYDQLPTSEKRVRLLNDTRTFTIDFEVRD